MTEIVHQVELPAAPAKVFDFLHDPARRQVWDVSAEQATLDREKPGKGAQIAVTGRKMAPSWEGRYTAFDAPKRSVLEVTPGAGMPFRSLTETFEIRPSGSGSILRYVIDLPHLRPVEAGRTVHGRQPSAKDCQAIHCPDLRPLHVSAGPDARAAEDYDLIYPDWDEAVERIRRLLAGHLPEPSGRTLLDCTCGSGMTAQAAQELGWRVTGVDASPAMLDRARTRLPDVELIACDVRALNQVLKRTFDAVVSVGNELTTLPPGDLPHALAQMQSRCKSGGAAMIVIRDLTERPRSGVWRDDALCRATARFVQEGPKDIRYTLEISDAHGVRTPRPDAPSRHRARARGGPRRRRVHGPPQRARRRPPDRLGGQDPVSWSPYPRAYSVCKWRTEVM